MANLKEVRNRIASTSSTMQITSAMKMVSASKLRKAQNAVISLRPYSYKLNELIKNICSFEDISTKYSKRKERNNVLLVVLTSNKGLCGGFNANIIKAVRNKVEDYYNEDKYLKVHLLSIGKRGSEFFKKFKGISYVGQGDDLWDNLTFENIDKIAQHLIKQYEILRFDKIEIIYNQFKNTSSQIITIEDFLPIINDNKEEISSNNNYIFEPSKEQIYNTIIPQALKTQLFRCCLESFAAEHGARMTAMHKATDNAEGLLKELKLSYNKARQAAITNEIIEICSAAEALRG